MKIRDNNTMKGALQKSLLVCSLCLLFGCASPSRTADGGRSKKTEERLAALEIQLKDQTQQIEKLTEQLNEKKGKLKESARKREWEADVEIADPSLHSAESSMPAKTAVRLPPPTGEVLQKQLHKPESPSPTARLAFARQLKKNSRTSSVGSPSLKGGAATPLFGQMETIADSSQEDLADYVRGTELFKEQKWDEAIRSFRLFLSEKPTHVYADRAQFMILESHFRGHEFGLALVDSHLLETHYPYSVKFPEALYRRGLSLLEMNQVDQAKTALEQLIKRYPNEPVTELARQKWVQIEKKPLQP